MAIDAQIAPPNYKPPTILSREDPNAPAISGEGKPRSHYLTFERPYRIKQFGTTTIWDVFQKGKAISENNPFVGRRVIEDGVAKHFVWTTYAEAAVRVNNIANGLVYLGLKPQSMVGIFAKNSPEYLLTELALFRQRSVCVPIYETLISDKTVLVYMANLTELSFLFTSSPSVKTILEVKSEIPSLKHIVTFDQCSDELKEASKAVGITTVSFNELEELGRQNMAYPCLPESKDLAYICFTSGTTGMPKGVMLLHSMLTAVVDRLEIGADYGTDIGFTPDDVHISYLPKAHAFEMALDIVFMGSGSRIGFWQGDVKLLMDDIAELKPTVLASTPRIYNRIYDRVMGQVSKASTIKKAVFNAAFMGKRAYLGQRQFSHSIWDTVIFNKIRQTLGGRIRLLVTGAAPISKDVAEFLQIAFSVPLVEGYGQTESCASTTVVSPIDPNSLGTVGVPCPSVYVKLVDVPDMGYLSSNNPPAGEICFKGPTAFPGYYKDPVNTAETIDPDGWVHTGDIGMWDELGHLKIIDRKKNLFKLAQGEYVSPEKIEGVYSKHELVESMFVHGESTESHVVAIVVIEKDALTDLLAQKSYNVNDKTIEELVVEMEVRRLVAKELNSWVRSEGSLKGFEVVKDLVLEHRNFADLGLLTPTFKLKRNDAKKMYLDKINGMYSGDSSVMTPPTPPS